MKNVKIYVALACIFVLSMMDIGSAEDGFVLEAPDSWRTERIVLPPPFAQDMTFRGVEMIRFAPEMFAADADTFFTYVFVLSVEAQQLLTQEEIQRELLQYYRGLAQAVMKASDQDVSQYSLTVIKQPATTTFPENAVTPVEYEATLSWVEPFTTRLPQDLILEIQSFRLAQSDRSFLFVCASPKAKTHDVWQEMRQIRQTLRAVDKVVSPAKIANPDPVAAD